MEQGKRKKIYSKPLLEVVSVDNEISLVMMTTPPENGPFEAAQVSPSSGPLSSGSPSSGSNPFGGSSPDYD